MASISKLCFAFPHSYYDLPVGDYFTLNYEIGSGWLDEHQIPDPNVPQSLYEALQELPYNPSLIVPMIEESVLAAGYANDKLGLPGLGMVQAIRCTYRAEQRKRIEEINPDLNPQWLKINDSNIAKFPDWLREDKPVMLKGPASTLNTGVIKLDRPPQSYYELFTYTDKVKQKSFFEIARLRRVVDAPFCVIEEYIEEPQFEISGIVDKSGNICHWFDSLHQSWHDGRISKYDLCLPSKSDELKPIAEEVVTGFGLRGCGFNVEIRQGKVIEIQARLGEDTGSYEKLYSSEYSSAQLLYNYLN